jgi:hypothetical protein
MMNIVGQANNNKKGFDTKSFTSLDRYDITQAFSYNDVDYSKLIPIADVHEIFLSLGIQPNDITIPQLKDAFIAQQQKQSESVVVAATKVPSSASVSFTLLQVMELFQSVSINFQVHQRNIARRSAHSVFIHWVNEIVSP